MREDRGGAATLWGPVLIVSALVCQALDAREALAAGPRAAGDGETLVMTLAGDVGLNPTNQVVNAKGVYDNGFQTWADTTSAIRDEIDGDLNFINVETIVTDRNDLPPDLKGQSGPFNFRMHPNGLEHLVGTGFNVLSLANNHSMDYGVAGLEETLAHVGALEGRGLLGAAGVGLDREQAGRPEIMKIRGAEVAFAAIGIVTNNLERHRAGPGKPGQIAYRFDEDFAEVRRRLTAAPAAFRILSVHYGVEGQVRADAKQTAEWRDLAAGQDGIELIVGHHAHVVRGVEMHGRSLIFYGLGNFLHHGTANMTAKGICRDYGLLARVYAVRANDGRLEIEAVEALPVTDTHFRPRRLLGDSGRARIHVLNYLAATLDNAATGARGLRFTPQKDGRGLFCAAGAGSLAGRIGALCKGFSPAPEIPANLRGTIAASCSR